MGQVEEMEDDSGGQADLVGGVAVRGGEYGCVEVCMAGCIWGSGHAHSLLVTESVGVQDQVIGSVFCKYV